MDSDLTVASLVSLGHTYEQALESTQATQSTDIQTNVAWIKQKLEASQGIDVEKPNLTNPQQPVVQSGSDNAAQQPPTEAWISVSTLVDQEHVKQLQDMGFSKEVSEKALFLTQEQKTVEAALAWTEQHQDDPDFEEPLSVKFQEDKPKLSDAEAKQKARELQAKLRDDRKKREEQDEYEKEKKRVQAGKSMGDAQRDIQELKKRQDALQLKQQREQDAIDRQKILDQLQRDKEERFGKKAGGQSKEKPAQKEPTQIEKFEVGIKQIKVAHPRNLSLDKAQVCIQTIIVYLTNIVKNPTEEKFRKINQENKAFQSRVADCFGAKNSLLTIGFVEDGTVLINSQPNIPLLQQALTILEKELSSC